MASDKHNKFYKLDGRFQCFILSPNLKPPKPTETLRFFSPPVGGRHGHRGGALWALGLESEQLRAAGGGWAGGELGCGEGRWAPGGAGEDGARGKWELFLGGKRAGKRLWMWIIWENGLGKSKRQTYDVGTVGTGMGENFDYWHWTLGSEAEANGDDWVENLRGPRWLVWKILRMHFEPQKTSKNNKIPNKSEARILGLDTKQYRPAFVCSCLELPELIK